MLPELKFDEKGLIPAIIQDIKNGEVLMMAYMDRTALEKTIETGLTHFWSRSRQKYWLKGETSGHVQEVNEILYDCDEDTLLIKVTQIGAGACHTGRRSCFFRNIEGKEMAEKVFSAEDVYKKLILEAIYDVIIDRKNNPKEDSYVSSLFKKGKDEILKKIGEESVEVVVASKGQGREQIVYELADLWFHSLVLMAEEGIKIDDIYNELQRRFGKSGLRK